MPQVRRWVSVSQVRIIDRKPIGVRTYELAMFLDCDGTVPPIHVVPGEKGQFNIIDGRHRFLAHKLVGRKKIQVRYGVKEGSSGVKADNGQGSLIRTTQETKG